ncbi:MAG TPA: hypothetical protein VI408_07350 [Gaiellaceae bacterium]
MKRLALIVALAAAVAGAAGASAPPVGPLPPGPTITVTTYVQEYVAIALPRGGSGLTWRAAAPYSARVVRPFAEQDVGALTVLVYLAVRPGIARLNFGLTQDEHVKAYRGARYRVIVKPRPR